jgi:hypothetical protein
MASTEDELAPLLEALEVEVPDHFDEALSHEAVLAIMEEIDQASLESVTNPNDPHFPGNFHRSVTISLDGQTITAIEVVRPDGEKHYMVGGEVVTAEKVSRVYGMTSIDDERYLGSPELGHELPGLDR